MKDIITLVFVIGGLIGRMIGSMSDEISTIYIVSAVILAFLPESDYEANK